MDPKKIKLSISSKAIVNFFKELNTALWSLIKRHYPTIIILAFFGTIYSLLSIVNHYNFRTAAFDLGIYNNAIFDYSKFQINDNPVMHIHFDNILSDHFSLLLMVFAPLRYIFGTYTLLIIQIVSILFGGVGAYKVVLHLTKNVYISRFALVHFLSVWAIYSALAFDYHDNVVGSMLVSWLIYFFLIKKWKLVAIFAILMMVTKENMALWLIFIFAGLLLLRINDKTSRIVATIGIFGSLLYFVLILKVVMPGLANESRGYAHLKYSILGTDFTEIFDNIFKRPKRLFSYLFVNHTTEPVYDHLKTELHFMLLVSGGIGLIYKPQFLLMLIPIFAQKLFHNDYVKWGITCHYSIEFVPILTISFYYWISELNIKNISKYILVLGSTILCLVYTNATFYSMELPWYKPHLKNIFIKSHYERPFNVEKVHKLLKLIPKDAKVCAQNSLVPHLAFREKIYTFPYMLDAEYIALLPKGNPYPFRGDGFTVKLESLKKDSSYITLHSDEDFILLKRKH